MKFQIEEEVIALTNPKNERCQQRVKGNKYKVNAVMYCSGCGEQHINIGEKCSNLVVGCHCETRTPTNGLQWTRSIHFQRPQKALEVALAEEDYDLAIKIRDNK